MKTTRLLTAAAALFTLAHTLGCVSPVDSDPADLADLDEETGESAEALVNGTTTTGFVPVVRISWTKSYSCGLFNLDTCTETHLCTATAISDDMLVTASHCVKDGQSEADYIKVEVAHGANSGSAGKTSSYLIMSEDIYNNISSNDYNSYYYRDFAFVKFGAGTFSDWYDTTYVSSSPVGTSVVKVGFGGDSTKEYGTKTIGATTTHTSGAYRTSYTTRTSGAYNENGDSGGPILKMNSSTGKYEVLGVVYGHNTDWDYHPTFTSAMETNILSQLRTNVPKYCSELYEHSNYGGFPWSFCNTTSLDNQLDSFADPFIARSHWKYSAWNDKATSLELPTGNTVLTLYKDSSQGGSSVTYQNIYPFGDGSSVPDMNDDGFNDKMSSFRVVNGGSAGSYSWHIEITRHGKCIDTSGTHTVGRDVYQWDCQDDNDNQIFKITSSGSYYKITHSASGLCLGAEGGGTSNGTRIELQTCDGSTKQQFDMFSNGTTDSVRDFKMKNVNSGKCVDLDAGSSSNGTYMQLWSCSSSNLNQNFAINNR
ncbi:MAG: RICIN domain-containing protein [Polyangiaceae bacterium]